jgi:methionine synthase II (cobalamin-independent)
MVRTTAQSRGHTALTFPTVGSFLRPDSVHEARDQFLHEKISAEELRKVEDEAIKALVAKQEEVGLQSVSDGEFRREYFHLDFLKHLGGIEVKENKLVGEKKWVLSLTRDVRKLMQCTGKPLLPSWPSSARSSGSSPSRSTTTSLSRTT